MIVRRARLIGFAISGLLAIAGVSSGCASIMTGFASSQNVRITSVPEGMRVRIELQPPAEDLSGDTSSGSGSAPGGAMPESDADAWCRAASKDLTTPCTVRLLKSRPYRISLSRPGYETAVLSLTNQPSDWFYTNVLMPLGVLVFMPIDYLFGTHQHLVPISLSVTMDRLDLPTIACADEFSIGTPLDVEVRWVSGPRAAYRVLATATDIPAEVRAGDAERFAEGVPVPLPWGLVTRGMEGVMNEMGTAWLALEVRNATAPACNTIYLTCIGIGERGEVFRSPTRPFTIQAGPP